MSVSSKEFFDIQRTTEYGFTLKRVRDMIRKRQPKQCSSTKMVQSKIGWYESKWTFNSILTNNSNTETAAISHKQCYDASIEYNNFSTSKVESFKKWSFKDALSLYIRRCPYYLGYTLVQVLILKYLVKVNLFNFILEEVYINFYNHL